MSVDPRTAGIVADLHHAFVYPNDPLSMLIVNTHSADFAADPVLFSQVLMKAIAILASLTTVLAARALVDVAAGDEALARQRNRDAAVLDVLSDDRAAVDSFSSEMVRVLLS